MKKRSNVLVGLDIGTTKTTAIVGEITETGIDIIGIGTSQAKEIRKGTVVNIEFDILGKYIAKIVKQQLGQ